MKKKNHCSQCKHYFVTWDPSSPKGCRAYKIQSSNWPCMAVAKHTKEGCLGFEPREQKAKVQKKELDLNSDDLW